MFRNTFSHLQGTTAAEQPSQHLLPTYSLCSLRLQGRGSFLKPWMKAPVTPYQLIVGLINSAALHPILADVRP